MANQITIKKFDISKIDFNRKCVFIGKTGTGKSMLVQDLLHNFRNSPDNLKRAIPVGKVISSTEHASPFYSKMIPRVLIEGEYSKEKIAQILEIQKKRTRDVNLNKKPAISGSAFLILDDCLHEAGSWKKDKNIMDIFYNGRHYNLLFLLTMQYPLGIPPSLRTNIDYTFILREPIKRNKKIIYENFAGMFDTFEDFCKALDSITENFGCMVIDNTSRSNKISDQVFYYRAQNRDKENFKLCNSALWKNNKKSSSDLY